MTPDEWDKTNDPQEMVRFLQSIGRLTDRKVRLFAAAVARRVWHLFADERSRTAVRVAEGYADAVATDDARWLAGVDAEAALSAAQAVYDREVNESIVFEGDEVIVQGWRLLSAADAAAAARATALPSAEAAARQAARAAADAEEWAVHAAQWAAGTRRPEDSFRFGEKSRQADLIRCVFGDPHRPPQPLEPFLLSGTVVDLAQAAYGERILPQGTLDPARLAVLADAIEESGCTDAGLLAHLRAPGPHVRGCHALDLILGKT